MAIKNIQRSSEQSIYQHFGALPFSKRWVRPVLSGFSSDRPFVVHGLISTSRHSVALSARLQLAPLRRLIAPRVNGSFCA